MSTSLTDLVDKLYLEYTVNGNPLFTKDQITAKAELSIAVVNDDFSTSFVVDDSNPANIIVNPDVEGVHYSAWYTLTSYYLCNMRVVGVSDNVDYKSGDKSISRGKSSATWRNLCMDLYKVYNDLVDRYSTTDDYAELPDWEPSVYRKGSEEDNDEHKT